MLSIEGYPLLLQLSGYPVVDFAKPLYRCEQTERPAFGSFEQRAVSACHLCRVILVDIADDQHPRIFRIIERRRHA
jgi:hypothetical protein